ncbi:hypothetical protein G6553_16190 [Nocardioides sp. IC4_145]|uniref:hypothetical protein n=1 Tax=Nocardioides sp. IC4_145 TaxID=2714037 RepID=UPI00140B8437|nr:hypothetical protein [Nocardioides sp. IC4_145]NHC24706.1 hypothetical protein [Nocardioides sp. IC4_145]
MDNRLARALGASLLMSGCLTLLVAFFCYIEGEPDGVHASAVWVLTTLGLLLVGNSLVVLVVESQVRAERASGVG